MYNPMRAIFILLVVLIQLNLLNAQEVKVDIYLVSEHVIITGVVTDSIGDSIVILTDKHETLAFAKSGMQGLNYGVSKELKKLQLQLIRDETKLHFREIPGKYQIKKGEHTKGKILYLIAYAGIGCFVAGGTGAIIGLPTLMYASIAGAVKIAEIGGVIFLGSLQVFLAGMITLGVAGLWTQYEITKDAVARVKNRYYYTGESMTSTGQISLPAD
jgi:hypothetical protein